MTIAVPQSVPTPTSVPFTTCEWITISNSTSLTEIEDWLSCSRQYANSTINSNCIMSATLSSNAHSPNVSGPVTSIGMMVALLLGVVVQVVLLK